MGIVGKAVSAGVLGLAFGTSAAYAQDAPYALGAAGARNSVGLKLERNFGPLHDTRSQGLSVRIVGRPSLLPSLGVFGKVGSGFARPDTTVMGNGGPEQGFGFAYGGGVSYDFSPRLSASLEWDSYDLRLPVGPVRATSLGLQYRY
ncbi:MAG TPA: outer membrane beta-barrel protein [Ramlibacter sp.]|jgi:opacity protein-like surface antigen